MECGKLTAKLRDAVPVIFIEEGREPKRFKNIEIPDELKAIEYKDFKFDVPENRQHSRFGLKPENCRLYGKMHSPS